MTDLTILHLLVAYAICFGIQNKLTFLFNRAKLLDRLLSCTYCLGFHCGWLAWLMQYGATNEAPAEGWAIPLSVLMWALCSAASCYVLDAGVRWLEESTPKGG